MIQRSCASFRFVLDGFGKGWFVSIRSQIHELNVQSGFWPLTMLGTTPVTNGMQSIEEWWYSNAHEPDIVGAGLIGKIGPDCF